MNKLSIEIRQRAIEMVKMGQSQRKVAAMFGCSHTAIQNLWKKYNMNGYVENLPKSGRPSKTSERERKLLRRYSIKDPFMSTKNVMNNISFTENISLSTAKRILRKYGLVARKPAKKPFLTTRHIKIRKLWCKNYLKWTEDAWKNVVYSDEARFELMRKPMNYVRRLKNQRFLSKNTNKTLKKGSKSIMIFGCIKYDGQRLLCRCSNNMDSTEYVNILKDKVSPFLSSDNIYIQDNAPIHRSKKTLDCLGDLGIYYIDDWPPQSPDLNIIEHMWAYVKKELCNHIITSETDLWNKILQIWNEIPTIFIQNLYNSIPRRLKEVIKLKGTNSHY